MKNTLLISALLSGLCMIAGAMKGDHLGENEKTLVDICIDDLLKDSQSIQQFFHDKHARKMFDRSSYQMRSRFLERISQDGKERFEEIVTVIVDCLNIRDDMMTTLFVEAIKQGSTGIINRMIQKGSQECTVAAIGLLIALENRDYEIAELIIKNFKILFARYPGIDRIRSLALKSECFDIVELIDELVDRST